MKKNIIKGALIFLAITLLIPILFIGYLTIRNPKYEDVIELDILNNPEEIARHDETFKATIFNLGYAGLDKDQDFFADGGKNSRGESYERVMDNLESMAKFLKEDNADFMLIQEIDRRASRSYDIEQYIYLNEYFSDYGSSFSYNYNAIWVPVPIFDPMGYANAGLGTYSKYKASQASRYELEGQESWPMILAELDRCIMETYIPLDNGKNLVLINLHLSAYDKGGELRSKQVKHLIRHMNDLYDEGHYVVLGGDWNQLLGTKQLEDPDFIENWPEWLVQAPDTLTETGFNWGIDESVMTVRDLNAPYEEGETFEAIIDGFLVSPNIEIVKVKGHDLGYEYTDHNPVSLYFNLIP